MHSLAMRIVVLWGWRRAVVAFIVGALSALSQAPYHFFPVLFITIPILIWLLDGIGDQEDAPARGFKSAFLTGWCFGFGYFLAGLYWVGLAFLVDAGSFAWMMPFAIVLLPMGLAFFTGLSLGIYYLIWRPNGFRVLSFAVLFVAGEWLRGHILTGFPWNLIGYSFAFSESLLQVASLVGGYGLSFICICVAASLSITSEISDKKLTRFSGPLLAMLLLSVIFVYGTLRIGQAGNNLSSNVSLRIVQPNISQIDKWNPDNRSQIISKLLNLSNKPTSPETMGVENATHIIWPEVALPVLLLRDEKTLSAIAAMMPDDKFLITGTIRRELQTQTSESKSFNSIVVLDDQAKPIAIYDKSSLVPFGEYLPLANILEPMGLRKLVSVPTGFLSGPGRTTLSPEGTPAFSPLICYEAIFPGEVTKQGQRPLWLLNLTNDAWFGNSAGPYQHFQQARIRAIEEGLPMVRAANTGISAIIDPYGRIIASLALNREGVIDGHLPQSLDATLYAELGDFLLLFICCFCLMLVLITRKYNSVKR